MVLISIRLGILKYDCVDIANHFCPLHRRAESNSKHSVCQPIFIFILCYRKLCTKKNQFDVMKSFVRVEIMISFPKLLSEINLDFVNIYSVLLARLQL